MGGWGRAMVNVNALHIGIQGRGTFAKEGVLLGMRFCLRMVVGGVSSDVGLALTHLGNILNSNSV